MYASSSSVLGKAALLTARQQSYLVFLRAAVAGLVCGMGSRCVLRRGHTLHLERSDIDGQCVAHSVVESGVLSVSRCMQVAGAAVLTVATASVLKRRDLNFSG